MDTESAKLTVGIACGTCDTFSPFGLEACPSCGSSLAIVSRTAPTAAAKPPRAPTPLPAPLAPPVAAPIAAAVARAPAVTRPPTQEELMDQARNYICKQCATPVPSGHKFCGRCGGGVPIEIVELQVKFFGAMQAPGKARLILIRGDAGVDGLSYLLQGAEHVAGSKDGQILFPEDAWLSPRHANFLYRGEKLFVRDEGSANGIYARVKAPVPLEPGDLFLCGEQIFRLDATPKDTAGPDPDQTYFYSSPKRPSPFRVVQILRGGHTGLVVCARENAIHIGREENDINFPEDVYMSGRHAKVELAPNGKYALVDNASKNGTYIRIKGEREVGHGDYLFLGKQLLRVEMTA